MANTNTTNKSSSDKEAKKAREEYRNELRKHFKDPDNIPEPTLPVYNTYHLNELSDGPEFGQEKRNLRTRNVTDEDDEDDDDDETPKMVSCNLDSVLFIIIIKI